MSKTFQSLRINKPQNYPPRTNCAWSAGKNRQPGVAASAVIAKNKAGRESHTKNNTGSHESNNGGNAPKTKNEIKHGAKNKT